MSDLENIKITKATILYSADSQQNEVKYGLASGTLASKDTSTVDSATFKNRFYIKVKNGVHKGKKGWIEDNTNHYQSE